MTAQRSMFAIGMLLAAIGVACGSPSAPAGQRMSGDRPEGSSGPQPTVVFAVRGEPPSVAARPVASFSGLLTPPNDLFNAELDYRDEREAPHPYLAEALPELNTDSWKVFPDGTMETAYKLKPNLTWHDGQPLLAEDFAFAYRVYATPDLGQSSSAPIGQIQAVDAPDAQTVVIRWNQLYADAAVLEDGFPALPSHLLADPFRTLEPEAFTALPYWSTDYVGLGPYRVTAWEPGA